MQKYDVIVVGAGILGLAAAYHLKKQDQKQRVLLIDKLSQAAQGDAAKTGEGVRNFYSEKTNYFLSDSTIDFYESVKDTFGRGIVTKLGYLWTFGDKEYKKITNTLENMQKMGIQMHFYEKEQLAAKLEMRVDVGSDNEANMMGLCDIEKGVLACKAGSLDTDALTRFYETNFRRLKGEVLYNTTVTKFGLTGTPELGIFGEPFHWQGKKITSVITNRGHFHSDKVVLTGGVWNSSLLDPLGIYYDVKPGKRQMFIVKAETEKLGKLLNTRSFNDENVCPVIVAPFKNFFIHGRKGENAFWISYRGYVGMESKLEVDPKPHENYFYYGTLPLITKYFPQFSGSKIFNMWAGLHVRMTAKELHLVQMGNLIIANAGSAYCFGDSVGRVVAAMCRDDKYVQLSRKRQISVRDVTDKIRQKGFAAGF